MDTIQSKDGTAIAFRQSGSGPPLVLIHGTTADHTRWAPVLSQLEKRFTVYAVDRRGRSQSTDTRQYAIEREFEDVAAVVDSIGESVYLLGHSYGALCCLESALLTNNIAKLILYEPLIHLGFEIYPPGTADRVQAMLDSNDRDGAVTVLFREIVKVKEEELEVLRSLPSWKMRINAAHTIPRETFAEEQYRFIPERFGELNIPVLLLLGGESPDYMKEPTKVINRALPDSRIAILPGQQHLAMNNAPDLFTNEIINFCLM